VPWTISQDEKTANVNRTMVLKGQKSSGPVERDAKKKGET